MATLARVWDELMAEQLCADRRRELAAARGLVGRPPRRLAWTLFGSPKTLFRSARQVVGRALIRLGEWIVPRGEPRLTRGACAVMAALLSSGAALGALPGCAPGATERQRAETARRPSDGAPDTGVGESSPTARLESRPGYGPDPVLPPPDTTHRAEKFARVVGWPDGVTPRAPEGFAVELFASGLQHPRWLYVLPNGDVLVAESNNPGNPGDRERNPTKFAARVAAGSRGPSANRITLLRDGDHDGLPELRRTFVSGLNRPFGMAARGNEIYIANTDALLRFEYEPGQLELPGAEGERVLELPAGGYNNHWTRNVVASPDNSKLYVTAGSGTNVDEEGVDAKDPRRAAILEFDPRTREARVFASGLRNPNGLAWAPGTGALWTAVNERDGLGEDLVPDYVTSVQEGAFYGWPYAYFGPNEEPRQRGRRPDLVARAVAPDYAVGAHTATMSIVFNEGSMFPERYRGGAFISQRGSWNRSKLAGYRVLFLPFENGVPIGPLEEFLTGFVVDERSGEVHGRPVGLVMLPDGSLLVADDAADRVWRVTYRPEVGSDR